jgi:spore cortex formation protein SpoVR/YcgB (stage V sporulation)
MYWATTTFKVHDWSSDLAQALKDWQAHIKVAHPLVTEVRCYRYDGSTTVVWQEGFANFNDYEVLMGEEDDLCDSVMGAVFRHMVPGTREGKIWNDGI